MNDNNNGSSALMKMARTSLEGKWGLAVGTFFVYMVIVSVASSVAQMLNPFASIASSLLIGGPFTLGLAVFSLNISRNRNAETGQIFEGFNNFGTALVAYLLMMLIVLAGFIALIVPGFILSLGLSMTFFIIADDSSIAPIDAIKKSWEMMKGHKADLFVLYLIFFGLILLSAFTLFIGLLWLIPYMQVTFAKFYIDIKGNEDLDITDHLVDDEFDF